MSLFNAEVEFAVRDFERTFDPNLTGENRQAVFVNLEKGYEKVARRACEIANFISELLAAYSVERTSFAKLTS